MNKIKILTLVFCAWSFALPVIAQISIVPLPQEMREGKGAFTFSGDAYSIKIGTSSLEQRELLFQQLSDVISKQYGISLEKSSSESGIWVGNPARDNDLMVYMKENDLWPNDHIGDQGYILHVEKNRIVIAAQSDQGLFYGVQSLKQLIKGAVNDELPAYTIIDWPDLAYRGVMDDISRGPVPHMEFMKSQIRRFSEMKINMMSFYIEHIVKTKSHGDFAPSSGGISIEEWKELSDYAGNYHVQLVGSFQSLGHFEKILSFPQYSHLGETDRMLSPVREESSDFLIEVIREMLPAFGSRFFNVNGDEAWDLGRGNLKKYADSIGVARIYADHMNRLLEFIISQGKRPMMWGDITLQHPEVFEMLPEEVMFLTWDYSAYESFADFIDPVKNAGYDFMVCPGVLNSNRMMPDFNMSVINIRNFVNEGFEKGASGVLNTVWDDGGRHSFSRDWYGVAFGADQSWNPNKKPLDEFDHRFSKAIYGDPSLNYTKAIHKTNELAEFGATQEMTNSIMWKQLIPERGKDLKLNLGEWDEIESVIMEAKSMLAAFETVYYPMDVPFLEFTMDQYLYLANARKNLIAASKNYALACHLQNEDRSKGRNHLITCLNNIVDSKQVLTDLKNRLQILWLHENRMHWYDQALEPYKVEIENYSELEGLVENAIKDFDQGHYLPSPQDIRLAIYEQEGRYFSYWLTCGPFHIENEYGPKPDFLEPPGGEAEVKPYPGLRFTAENGKEFMWDKYDSPTPAEINLKEYYEKNTDAVAYAYCRIESPVDKLVKATFGSNDGIVIYCNGQKVFQIHEKRSLIPDENEVTLPLKAGNNHILLKIDQWKGGWGFSFRLPEENVRNHKQKYKIIE